MLKKKIVAIIFIVLVAFGSCGYGSRTDVLRPFVKAVNEHIERVADGRATAYKSLCYTRDVIGLLFNNVLFSSEYINLNGWFQRIIGRRVVLDVIPSRDVVKLNNGAISFINPEFYDIPGVSERIIEFNNVLKKKNLDMIYIQAPFKITGKEMLPAGVIDHTNANADEVLETISAGGVKYLDLRKEMVKDEISSPDIFFRTDQHWKPEGGLWAFGKVSQLLNAEYGFDISPDLYNPDNYDYEIKENYFLGSQGKRVGIFYAGVDDISLMRPKFPTDLRFEVPDENAIREGDFAKTMFAPWHVDKIHYYKKNPYTVYIGGDFGHNILTNNAQTPENNKKILLIRDSFSCVFAPFMTLGCGQLDTIDLRYFTGDSLIEKIDEINPDLVIVLYNADMYNVGAAEEMFDFE